MRRTELKTSTGPREARCLSPHRPTECTQTIEATVDGSHTPKELRTIIEVDTGRRVSRLGTCLRLEML